MLRSNEHVGCAAECLAEPRVGGPQLLNHLLHLHKAIKKVVGIYFDSGWEFIKFCFKGLIIIFKTKLKAAQSYTYIMLFLMNHLWERIFLVSLADVTSISAQAILLIFHLRDKSIYHLRWKRTYVIRSKMTNLIPWLTDSMADWLLKEDREILIGTKPKQWYCRYLINVAQHLNEHL